jgi:hypothetical protein
MNMYSKKRWTFYTSSVEHYLRVAVRRSIDEVQGSVNQKWHRDTVQWLNEKCTAEERKLIMEFYTYNQSVRGCTNYQVTNDLYALIDCYASDMGLC